MIAWMFEGLVASTLLMALVMMLRVPVARHLGAKIAYMLWAIPVARLALPPLPRGTAADAVLPPSAIDGSGAYVVLHMTADAAAPQSAPFPWLEAGIALWLAGAILFCAIEIVAYLRFRRLMLGDALLIDVRGGVSLVESVHVGGPLAFGVRRKYVVLPVDFADRYTADERAMAIAHELTHHRRGDLCANLVALAVLALHWWNPLAWIAYRAFRADQELACDADVLARHGAAHAQAYGRAILKAASGRQYAAACHLNTIDNLKGRLKMLSTHSNSLRRISWGMTAVSFVTVAGLALTASGGRAAQEMAAVSEKVGNAHMVKLASFLPQSPEAPEAMADRAARAADDALQTADIAARKADEAARAAQAIAIPEPPVPPAPPAAAPRMRKIVMISPDGTRREHVIELPEPPAPPVPPLPPTVFADGKGHRVVVRTRDGKTITQDITIDDGEIARMIPQVDVDERCAKGRQGGTTQVVEENGRAQRVRVMICGKGIAREARLSALQGLAEARVNMEKQQDLSASLRTKILADLDSQIAKLKAEQD
ncbi:M56 family metallopeptidase [Sphingobium aquiterrae]|uniref:M56 family metallopeptidase n=1 Tax=Sphingobium aquiterrae TaxID=2038656 RepID=UPI00301B4048